jgi:hypothetical protein
MTTRREREHDVYGTQEASKRLNLLLMLPGNRTCADCKEPDPRWASYNLGVFLCIRCAGIHRGLGAHISKVRSVDLDTWTTEMVDMMERMGNELANRIWEARLPQPFRPEVIQLESFIRRKYENQEFVIREPSGLPSFPPSTLGDIGVPAAGSSIMPTTKSAASYPIPGWMASSVQPSPLQSSMTQRPPISLKGSLRPQSPPAVHSPVRSLPSGRVVTASNPHQPALQDWNQVLRRTALMSGHIGTIPPTPTATSSTTAGPSTSSLSVTSGRSALIDGGNYCEFPSNTPVDVSGGTGIPRWLQREQAAAASAATTPSTMTMPMASAMVSPVPSGFAPSYGYPSGPELMMPSMLPSPMPPGMFPAVSTASSTGRVVTALPSSYTSSSKNFPKPRGLQ